MKTIFSILLLLSISFNANAKIDYFKTDSSMEYFLNNGWEIINTANWDLATRFTLYKKKSQMVVCDTYSRPNNNVGQQCHLSPFKRE